MSGGGVGRGSERNEKPFGAQGRRWYALPNETNVTPAACVGSGALRGAVDNFSDRPQWRRTAEQRGGVDRQAQGRLLPIGSLCLEGSGG